MPADPHPSYKELAALVVELSARLEEADTRLAEANARIGELEAWLGKNSRNSSRPRARPGAEGCLDLGTYLAQPAVASRWRLDTAGHDVSGT
jgi:hypothetical protein